MCIGGGTSIDRIYRKKNKWGYWEDEKIVELDNFGSIPYCQIIDVYKRQSLYNIAFATNRTTADMILTSSLFANEEYCPVKADFSSYLNRKL